MLQFTNLHVSFTTNLEQNWQNRVKTALDCYTHKKHRDHYTNSCLGLRVQFVQSQRTAIGRQLYQQN